MYVVLFTLIVIDLVLLAGTSVMGIALSTAGSIKNHLLAGVLTTGLFCFTHVLVLFYMIGTGKDVRDAVEPFPELAARYVPWTRLLKRRVFPWATLAITLTMVAALMGAEVHSRLILAEGDPGVLPLRGVTGWWVHLGLVIAAVAVNLVAFRREVAVVMENRRGIQEINRALEEIERNAADAATSAP